MARRIIAAIVGSLKHQPAEEHVHFHARAGRPEPCYDRRCAYPRLDAA